MFRHSETTSVRLSNWAASDLIAAITLVGWLKHAKIFLDGNLLVVYRWRSRAVDCQILFSNRIPHLQLSWSLLRKELCVRLISYTPARHVDTGCLLSFTRHSCTPGTLDCFRIAEISTAHLAEGGPDSIMLYPDCFCAPSQCICRVSFCQL